MEDVMVASGLYQSREDYEANMVYDEIKDNQLQDEFSNN